MADFWSAFLGNPFLRNAAAAALLVSLACGIVGTYVVVRRITLLSGGIAHAVLGGMGAAYYFGGREFVPAGAVAAAVAAALVIGLVSLKAKEREDTVIGALWAVGMAVGILFIYKTPGYNADLMSFLFGNILLVTKGDLLLIALLDAVIVALVLLFYKRFVAICFDDEYSRIQGIRVDLLYLLLLCLIALTVVLLIQVVGIILVIALLTLPAAIAGHYARGFTSMMIIACLLGMVFTVGGLFLSYGPNLPPGATIIVFAGAAYLLPLALQALLARRKKSRQV